MLEYSDSIFRVDLMVVIILFAIGLYCLISKTNLIKVLIGIELVSKSVLLSFVLGGFLRNDTAFAQSIVFIIIVIEVVIVAIALSLIIVVSRHHLALDVTNVKRLKW